MEEKWFSDSIESVKAKLNVPDGGITAEEAEKRLAEYGKNQLAEKKKRNVI